ncbi:virulence metalloprotease [Octopus bimaculoides]|uniref:Peptidase M4 domain-containing protein n=1 Tax=Octopus bimaculoides TaxID=37653 RepID=A0A0L8GFI5_OCTBM|nr:virulence metalloprotease [Octopus bimaculoides]|eukprot:XP_014781458.1 PREDICTED: virulence metalloprotease-like [Octopus bimaculoides]
MRNLLVIFYSWQLLFGSLSLIKTSDAARRVDAHERARRMIYLPSSPFHRRHLDKTEVTVRDLLGLKEYEEVEESNRIKTAEGTEILRLQEKFLGVPVFDASLTVTQDKDGHLTGDATGTFIQGIEDDITNAEPKLSKLDVFDIAFKAEGDEIYAKSIQPEYKIMIFLDENDKSRLAYHINYRIENEEVIKRPTFVIDGNTGEILLKYNNLDTISRVLTGSGGNEKSGIYKFSEKNHKAFVTQIGEMCFLENNYVKVIDMQNRYSEDFHGTDPIYYLCDVGFNDSVNTAISPALDAFYYGSMISQMFQEWFNSSILNKQAILRVHYGIDYENAFWDGEYCSFGDGDTNVYPLVVADVIGHELAHGFTEQHSGLLYKDQSGSINEAFSDITGEVTEAYMSEIDWFVGFDVIKEEGALRYMANPSLDNESVSHVDNFTANMNVHYGSGIYNFIFYYIVHELKMDIKETYQVFLIANTIYWHYYTDFISGACDMLKVAYDLGKDLTPFIKAFEVTGIKPCDLEKHIQRLSFGKTISGIRVSVEANPVFDFIYPKLVGNITIIATGMCGKVHIKLSKYNMLTEGDGLDPDTLLAEGTSEVTVRNLEGPKFFIKLSPESRENLENVTLHATYACDPYFVAETYEDYELQELMCDEDSED